MIQSENIPKWFKTVAIIAIIWNLMGVMAFVLQTMMTSEMIALLPEAEQKLYENIPVWATVAFACAVWGGFFGSALLFAKKQHAFIVLSLSLVGVIVQMYHNFIIIDSISVYGPGGMIMPLIVLIIAAYLVYLANDAKSKSWIS